MPPVQLQCPNCQQAMSVETDRLPDQAALLQCPSCQAQMKVEKSRLLASLGLPSEPVAPPPEPVAPPPDLAAPPSEPVVPPSTPAPAAPEPSQAPAQPAAPQPVAPPPQRSASPPPHEQEAQPVMRIDNPPLSKPPEMLLPPAFSLRSGTQLPSGIVVCRDPAVLESLRTVLGGFGSELVPLDSVDNLGQYDVLPELIVYVADPGVDPGPALEPLRHLPSKKRRRTFVVLVSDRIASLDGQQAFLHQVDLVVHHADLEKTAEVLYLALEFKGRLWGPLLRVEDAAAAV